MKNNNKIVLTIIVLLLLFSCKEKSVSNKINEIVFIISNPDKITTNIGTGINIKTLDRFNYDISKISDTVNVKADKYRNIYLRNDNTFKNIICEKGDTVYLNIDKNNIVINIKDRVFKKYDTLSLAIIYENSLKKEILETKSFEKKIYIKDDWTQKKKLNKTFTDSNKNLFLDYYKSLNNLSSKYNEILDKILLQDSISLPYYHYFKSQNNYKVYSDILEAFVYSNDKYLKNKIIEYFNNEEVINDDFIAYGYLNGFISKILINKEGYNSEKAYDILPSFMSGNTLKYSQLICLKEIGLNYDISSFQTYKNKYFSSYSSMETKKIVETIIEISDLNPVFIEEKDLSQLQLQDLNGKPMTLGELLNFNSDKVIYIDFWASWCVPCRQLMPASEKLRAEYANKDISFIYISIDNDIKKWSTASHDEGLYTSNYNLLATNFPKASLYEKIKLKSIPRYLIIKKRMIEYKNAPHPNNKKIREIFDKYLEE